MRVLKLSAAIVAVALIATACGGSPADAPSTAVAGEASAASATPSQTESPVGDGYVAVSDVAAHAAVGQDFAQIRELLVPAKEGGAVDWAAVSATFTEGGASVKSDGTIRTLASLAPEHAATALAVAAAAGAGASAKAKDAVRVQQVDKAITVLLAAKVIDELTAAQEKVAAGETDPSEGAPHNVDEAWAFFTAEEQGPALTADKRGADFSRDLRGLIIVALTAAQEAAIGGDAAAFAAAKAAVVAGLNEIFYLATYKYLDHKGEAAARAEGESFYLGIHDTVAKASAKSDAAITKAFASGDEAAGRAALNNARVLTALGIDKTKQVTD